MHTPEAAIKNTNIYVYHIPERELQFIEIYFTVVVILSNNKILVAPLGSSALLLPTHYNYNQI